MQKDLSRKLTLPQLKKYDITQKVIEALADAESRTILFSIIKKGRTASELSEKYHIQRYPNEASGTGVLRAPSSCFTKYKKHAFLSSLGAANLCNSLLPRFNSIRRCSTTPLILWNPYYFIHANHNI